jgi:hypothetical protein
LSSARAYCRSIANAHRSCKQALSERSDCVNTLVLGACLFPVGQLPDDYRTVKHLIDFDKAPDKARDKVYSTPGGALMSRYDPSAFGYLSRHVSALRPSNSDKKKLFPPPSPSGRGQG